MTNSDGKIALLEETVSISVCRGRPKLNDPNILTTIRLDFEIVSFF